MILFNPILGDIMRNGILVLLVLGIGLPCFSTVKVDFMTPKLIDFGEVREGEILNGTIQFVNTGDETVSINRVQPSCGCTLAELNRTDFAPGDTATIPFTLNTTHFAGLVRKSIHIYFKNQEIPNEQVTLQANIFTELELNPSYLYFQNITVNPDTVITQYAKIKNQSDKPVHISVAAYTNDNYKIIPEKFTVPAGETYLVRVEMVPRDERRDSITFTFETDLPTKPSLPLYVSSRIKSANP